MTCPRPVSYTHLDVYKRQINNFNVIYLLTAGGPFSLDYYQAGKTDLLVTWLYKLTVDQHDYCLLYTSRAV